MRGLQIFRLIGEVLEIGMGLAGGEEEKDYPKQTKG
jgi:hypothetical protein